MNRLPALVLLLAAGTAAPVEIEYTAAENAKCEAEGGCHVVTFKALRQLYGDGHKAGVTAGMLQCRT